MVEYRSAASADYSTMIFSTIPSTRISTHFEDWSDHCSTRGIDDQFLFGDVFRAHWPCHPSPCVSHIMCCAFFMKFQDNTCRNKVEIIMERQIAYLLIKHLEFGNDHGNRNLLHKIGKMRYWGLKWYSCRKGRSALGHCLVLHLIYVNSQIYAMACNFKYMNNYVCIQLYNKSWFISPLDQGYISLPLTSGVKLYLKRSMSMSGIHLTETCIGYW